MILFYILKKFILIILFYISFFLFKFINFSSAVEPEEFMQDEKNELRARDISKNIRCLVCQNQSIDDSSAELAKDLRILIRKKLVMDRQIKKYMIFYLQDMVTLFF